MCGDEEKTLDVYQHKILPTTALICQREAKPSVSVQLVYAAPLVPPIFLCQIVTSLVLSSGYISAALSPMTRPSSSEESSKKLHNCCAT